ncbi:MAG: hypothetical protein LIO97_02020, partial [Tannerellaceae bacterium]|nr:hypothetical protein [Tannerellaceae bacterium]
YSFSAIFADCKNLKNIPEGLFANCLSITSFRETFKGCESLAFIPENLSTSNPLVNEFSYTFKNCNSLQGKTPTTYGVEIWERSSSAYPQYPDVINVEGCLEGCYQLENYAEIPDEAK